jgi:hypothetical protein
LRRRLQRRSCPWLPVQLQVRTWFPCSKEVCVWKGRGLDVL